MTLGEEYRDQLIQNLQVVLDENDWTDEQINSVERLICHLANFEELEV